jgi:hypothetical protein
VQECVTFYYYSKLTVDYKAKLKLNNQRKRQKNQEAARAKREERYGAAAARPRQPKTPRSAPPRVMSCHPSLSLS